MPVALWILAAWQLCLSTLAEDLVKPMVTRIEPNHGSYAGATRLYIHGQGFSTSGNFNSPTGQASVGNKAYLISDFETVPCDVENDASHERMIVCYTRPMSAEQHYFVQVEVDGNKVPFEENCNRRPRDWRCRFIPRWYKTPYIRYCHANQEGDNPMQKSYAPGGLITCSGRLFTQIYGSNNQTNENGRTVSIRRAYNGGQTCELLREPDVFYNLRLTNGDEGIYTCKSKGTYVGVQNVSLILTDDFGRAAIAKEMMKTNSKDKVYNFQTYAEITSVSPGRGSVEGGTRVTVLGRYFDQTNEPIKVYIGGNPCAVIPETLTDDKVECIAGNPPEKKDFYPGSRGVLVEVWNETTVDNEAALKLERNASNYEGATVIDNAGWQWKHEKDSFVSSFTAIFVAPKTDRYKFKIAADDRASLFINCEGNRTNLTRVAYTNNYVSTYTHHVQSSDWITLEQGRECFFVSTVVEHHGLSHMYVGVNRASTTLTYTQSVEAKNEVQNIDFSATHSKEKQLLNFTEWSSQAGTIEEQEVTVKHSCIDSRACEQVGYRLAYEGVKTLFINADASASAVRNALRDIFELSDEDIQVSDEKSAGTIKYTVQFGKKRGDYSPLSFEKYPPSVTGLTVKIEEKTKGVSERKTYRLRLGGRATAPVAENAEASAIQDALDATRSAYCPSFLLPDKRKPSVVTTIDYEMTKYGNEWGSRRTDVEPFCGKTSVLNCEYVYYAGRTADDPYKRHSAFDAATNKWLCLAHLGPMYHDIHLTGTFRGDDRTITGSHVFTNPLQTHESQWKYSCIDLMKVILSRPDFAHVDQVTLSVIRFIRKGRNFRYYLDAITIGSEKVTSDLEGVLGVRTPPALANGHPLSKIKVEKLKDEKAFEVEVDTHDCGDRIPLISLPFAGSSFVATRIVAGVAPMTGEFDLTVKFHDGRAYNVTGIPVDISGEKFAERLSVEVPGFGQAKVTWGGSCHARDYRVEWLTNGGDKPLMEVRMKNITGASNIQAKVVTWQDGGIMHHPVTGDMTRLAFDTPQIEVFVNGYASKCVDSCEFVTSEDSTPIISMISPTSGSVHIGTAINIKGTKLDSSGGTNTTVKVGEAECEITSSSATSITCNLQAGPLGTFDIVLNVAGKGYARKESEGVSLAFNISGGVDSIAPASGFSAGGTEVVISGYGFSKNTVFTLSSTPCEVVNFTPTQVTCITPQNPVGEVTVTATDGTIGLVSDASFTYNSPDVTITSTSPSTSLLSGGQNLTISGSNLDQPGLTVRLEKYQCKILESSASKVICLLPSAPQGVYKILVNVPGKGYAGGSSSTINYKLEVTNVSPAIGSIIGGTKVTITGIGFADKDSTEVKFGDSSCKIDSISSTQIECTTGRATKMHTVTISGGHPSNGPGFAWDPIDLNVEMGDTVSWNWEIQGAPGGWDYGARVFTVASAESDVYDEKGFQSSSKKSEKGTFSYTFNNVGTFYISSGKVDHDDWGSIIMKGSVSVGEAKATKNRLALAVGGHEASYKTGVASRKKRSTCSGSVSSVSGCVPATFGDDSTGFFVTSDICYTPKITSISPTQGTSDTTITIKGEGFAVDNCANKVILAAGYDGEYECIVKSSTSTKIKCKPSPVEATLISTAFFLKVYVDSIGDSISVIQSDSSRRFALLPNVESVSPTSGSLSGGTLVTITGSGFSSTPASMNVVVGSYPCAVTSAKFFEIQCLTPASAAEATRSLNVSVNGQAAECTGNCQFSYQSSVTPTITSVAPSSIDAPDTEIVLSGTAFTSDESKVTVAIGDKTCNVTSSTSSTINCVIAFLPAGNHALHASITGKGKAKLDGAPGSIQSHAVITTMTPINGSRAGGTEITFTGNGFYSEDLTVKLGNKICEIKEGSITNFMFKCVNAGGSGTKTVSVIANGKSYSSPQFKFEKSLTPEITSISPVEGFAGEIVEINGTLFEPDSMVVKIGGTVCKNVTGTSTSVRCVVGEHAGGRYPVSATIGAMGLAETDVMFNYTFDIDTVIPARGSYAGGDMVTITGKGFGIKAEVTICHSVCEHGMQVPNSEATQTTIKCRLSNSSGDVSTDKSCDVVVSLDGQTVTGNGLYTFAADKTPRVTGVSPERGGTQGGTNITITGTLFDADKSKISVKIGGVTCDVTSSTATEIWCTTKSRGQSVKGKVEVTVDGKGLAINDNVDFYYVDVWSSKWTWGGQDPPVEGDFVVVPTGQTLVIDVDTPVLKMLLIQGGVVIFDEKDVHLQCENILITDGGVFQVGTEEQPFQHRAVITLHGHLRSPELPIYGAKTIGVRNGTLDLHGKHVPITWTLLAETSNAGSKTLKLQQAVTWKAGDEIVIASTGHRHSQKETEVAEIQSVSSDKRTLTLKKPINYAHISAMEAFDGVTLETHAEVGLLTRNVVVEGSKHMEWSKDVIPACEEGFDTGEFKTQTCFQGRFGEEEGSDQFGAQIMIHHRSPDLDIARARIEYVELRHVGQAFRLGRYPIHFHLLGDVNFNNYVRGCAIHHSFNRAVTIHNTHHLLVEKNVVYNIMGGAVFIEDGIEHGNRIQYNLVLFCRQSTSLQNDDITPAAFWVTNPNNTIQHNAAAGGTHFGFWYRIHATPDGPSADPNICQQLHPIEMFQNNTVHSQGWFGLWVFKKYTPKGDGSCGSVEPTIAVFHSLTVWNCEKGAELVNVGAIQFFDFIMAHNEKAGIETKLVVDTKVHWGQVGTYNSYIIAHAAGLTEGKATKLGIILPFAEGYEVNNTRFINFDDNATSAIGVTSIDGHCSVLCGGWEARFSEISFQNSPYKASFRWEHEVILRDRDGTLSETNKHSVITPYNPTISSTACPEITQFSNGPIKGVICDGSVKFHRVSWNKPTPSSLEAKDVSFTNKHGSSFVPYAKKRLTHKFGWMGTMMDGDTYNWVFQDAGHLTNISYESGFYNFEENDCVIVSHNLTQKPDKFIIAGDNENFKQDNMVTCSDNYHGDYYFDSASKTLFYIVSGRSRGARKKRFSTDSATPGAVNRQVNFKVYRCHYKDCIPPPDPNSLPPARVRPDVVQLWHETGFWKMNAEGEYVGTPQGDGSTSIPPNDKDIRIESGAWMVVKQDLPRLNKLWIEGVLEIDWEDNTLDVTLTATHIIIMGGRLIVGWEDAFFRGAASIVLRGNHNTEDILLDGGVNIGSKTLGVIGGLDLHGLKRTPQTTHLTSGFSKGQNTITLADSPVDWKAGDEIVIASTSYDPWETETFKIISISGKTVTLNASAVFDHIADTITYDNRDGEKSYDIRAEVSILTRNVKVIGEDYSGLFDESFGARIVIAGAGAARGYARIENVEFYHTGQEGWIDNYDPRFSLAFLNTGQVDTVKPSFVKHNAFHNGFNTAIGVFKANGLEVMENTIHHTVGPGIRVEGTDISLKDNLVMLARTKSVYQDRTEDDLVLWKAAIEVNLATSPVLSGNVVVGSERGGFRIDGHNCDASSETPSVKWGWNTARATLHGVWMNKDGFPVCTHISKFKIHGAYDDGIYYQGSGSVKISDVLVTDSNFGIAPIVYSPPSLSHAYREKYVIIENSVVVAVSKPDYCPTLPGNTDYVVNSANARGLKRTGANEFARAGILWPVFISSQNAAPSKPFVGSMSYPAIGGRTTVRNVTFVNFGDTSCSSDHTCFLTNLKVEDFLHPIETSELGFTNSPEKSKVFFHRPSIGAINPSDCVDMECDGMKHALIIDKDGSMLGSPGSVIPQAEFEWDGDPRRGLGDYRIPKTLLTNIDGSRIPVDDVTPYKGILRANTTATTCYANDVWQGHTCRGYNHGILAVESLDADTETRRLSPVALVADKYVDLLNGPQDHGWCAGYTCQERLSTFWTIAALGKIYEMHFSGTAPAKLRLRLLNEEPSTKMVLRIFYTRSQRLDVYSHQNYVNPLNYAQNSKGESVLKPPVTFDQFYPTINNFSGDNYHDRTAKIIHVTLGGNSVVEIHEAPVVVISFNLPAVSPDEFFDNGKLVENLALFLGIPTYKIRLVNAVREGSTSGRRKRNVGAYSATVEIGDPPASTIKNAPSTSSTTQSPVVTGGTTPASGTTSLEDLAKTTAKLTNALQKRSLSSALGTDVSSMKVADPRPPAERNPNVTNTTDTFNSTVSFFVPAGLRVVTQPLSGNAEAPFVPTLKVTGIDADNNDIVLGHSGDKWQATVTIQDGVNGAGMSGTTIAEFEKGIATFQNLSMSLPGSYVLKIAVTYPEGQSRLTVVTDPFTLGSAVVTATMTAAETTAVKVNPVDPVNPPGTSLAVIIGCSVLGGVIFLVVVALLILKGPCTKKSYNVSKVSHEDLQMSNSNSEIKPQPKYTESELPGALQSSLPTNEAEETVPPHSVESPKGTDQEKDRKASKHVGI